MIINIKLILYIIVVPLAIFALDALNINKYFKKNRVFQARLLYLFLSFSLAYLFTNFVYDFFLKCQLIK